MYRCECSRCGDVFIMGRSGIMLNGEATCDNCSGVTRTKQGTALLPDEFIPNKYWDFAYRHNLVEGHGNSYFFGVDNGSPDGDQTILHYGNEIRSTPSQRNRPQRE